ncbi:hypothetical protein BVRB_1g022850 [Beta vulgaris subsp. vulgaris]|uniref:Uncharacterized protein n=1 Tax=Beta vulgaris subsp. vulgaris TaxID=3555 RepID=A0A0J8BHS0_BETVV|nr:hypothetical protein BVRB_1g022850 [Beta vulgaris subsp. vulgaris]
MVLLSDDKWWNSESLMRGFLGKLKLKLLKFKQKITRYVFFSMIEQQAIIFHGR